MPTEAIEPELRNLDASTYDVAELAKLWKCTERHVRNMAAGGLIPGMVRIGRLVRFHKGIVNEWLIAQAKEGQHDA